MNKSLNQLIEIFYKISRSEYVQSTSLMESDKESHSFTPCQPREKWQKKRTSVKLKVSRVRSIPYILTIHLYKLAVLSTLLSFNFTEYYSQSSGK
jgi:hypothetical protein